MQLYLHNTLLAIPHAGLITIIACITLPEYHTDVCMRVQHSCPNLLLVKLNKFKLLIVLVSAVSNFLKLN